MASQLGNEQGGEFYSWLGGVLPQYRRNRVAKALAEV
jgi:ribosomal protein S18 acetylase RimI-like enzyme